MCPTLVIKKITQKNGGFVLFGVVQEPIHDAKSWNKTRINIPGNWWILCSKGQVLLGFYLSGMLLCPNSTVQLSLNTSDHQHCHCYGKMHYHSDFSKWEIYWFSLYFFWFMARLFAFESCSCILSVFGKSSKLNCN